MTTDLQKSYAQGFSHGAKGAMADPSVDIATVDKLANRGARCARVMGASVPVSVAALAVIGLAHSARKPLAKGTAYRGNRAVRSPDACAVHYADNSAVTGSLHRSGMTGSDASRHGRRAESAKVQAARSGDCVTAWRKLDALAGSSWIGLCKSRRDKRALRSLRCNAARLADAGDYAGACAMLVKGESATVAVKATSNHRRISAATGARPIQLPAGAKLTLGRIGEPCGIMLAR